MINAYKKALLAVVIVLASSCTLELQEDTNAVQIEQGLPSLILNSVQRNLSVLFNAANTSGAQMTRQLNGGGPLYLNATTPQTFNGLWTTAYADILGDINTLLEVADENGFARHAGMARVMQAYTLVLLVDMFGDVPFSESFQGSGNFNPKADSGAEIYAKAIEILEKAKDDLTTATTTALVPGYLNPVAPLIQDQYYNNDYSKWIKLANSIKLKIYLNLRLTDPAGSTAAINALIAEPAPRGGFITAANENFIWRYGTSLSDPAARHPRFVAQYPGGGGDYQSNWFIWHMFHGYDAVNTTTAGVAPGDPRMRFYFNRQVVQNSTSTNELRCLGESRPDHYPSASGVIIPNTQAGIPPMGVAPTHPSVDASDPAWTRTFCTPTNVGYWGRDHVDPQGIPPDGLLRTAYGPYPVGGRFDANQAASVAQTQGMQGAGMQPIMMRSFVQFMLAESALYLGTTGSARVHYQNGIQFSFDDVRAWSSAGTLGTSGLGASPVEAVIGTFYPAANYTADVAAYIASALAAYDNRVAVSSDEAMNYVAREYWISLFGNGYESYNLYRRTGKPTGMQPVINPTPGGFPMSFWYPANFADINSSVEQKADLSTKVFWDNTSFNLNF